MNVGIVGSGIAGLTAGWLLHRAGHRVTLFERQQVAGLDAHATRFERGGQPLSADVPSRMFNPHLWPNLVQLYREIGVDSQPVDSSQSYGQLGGSTYLSFDVGFRPRKSHNLWTRRRLRHIIRDIGRLKSAGVIDINAGLSMNITLADYLADRSYTPAFKYDFLYPLLASTVCTCSYQSLDHYPAMIILQTLRQLVSREAGEPPRLQRTRLGTRDVAQRLTRGLHDLRYRTQVTSIVPLEDAVQVASTCVAGEPSTADANAPLVSQNMDQFDQVIVATQANTALKILPKLTDGERETLACFSYEDIPVIVHTDTAFMPARRKHWSTFNMVTGQRVQHETAGDHDMPGSMCTVWLNRFYADWDVATPVFQTIHPLVLPDPSLTICATVLQRPVVNRQSLGGLDRLAELHGEPGRRIWFCGSYASGGVPLLESGVVSSLRLLDQLGIACPAGFSTQVSTCP